MPSYTEMIDRGLNTFGNSEKLAKTMLKAIEKPLNKQPNFDRRLEVKDGSNNRHEQKTRDTIRGAVEFLITTMIAEAADPASNVKRQFNSDLAATINRKRKFPEQKEMPHLEHLKDLTGQSLKEGRSPTADLVTIKLLKEMSSSGARFDTVFTPTKFPFMANPGGTAEGRKYLFTHGDVEIPSTVILEEARPTPGPKVG